MVTMASFHARWSCGLQVRGSLRHFFLWELAVAPVASEYMMLLLTVLCQCLMNLP